MKEIVFAGAQEKYGEAEYVILGVPLDLTSTYRFGTAQGPTGIRKMSYCYEPYIMDYGISVTDTLIHDAGDIESLDSVENMGKKLRTKVKKIVEDNKIPIILGGEHSLSPYAISAFEDVFVLILDAHLDFRDNYEGVVNSHATVSKRISELKTKGLRICGVRSMSLGEAISCDRPDFITSFDILENDNYLDMMMKDLPERIYLSLDIDVFDPSHAPGVGNPEQYGLTPMHVRKLISRIAPHVVGMDIVEVSPPHDHGDITSNLAARMVHDFLGSKITGTKHK